MRKTNSLIGTALRLLTDDSFNQAALKTSLGTLTRVLDAVDWRTITKDKPEAWLYFYEDFLEVYDNRLRKQTGSYYTPPEVVSAMVNLVDEVLRGPLFERTAGFAVTWSSPIRPSARAHSFLGCSAASQRPPYIPASGAIPSAPEPLPDTMEYAPATHRLIVGKGYIENVTPEMWTYEVSGKQVLWHWFSYRRRDRTRPVIGDRRRRSIPFSPIIGCPRAIFSTCCTYLAGSLNWNPHKPIC